MPDYLDRAVENGGGVLVGPEGLVVVEPRPECDSGIVSESEGIPAIAIAIFHRPLDVFWPTGERVVQSEIRIGFQACPIETQVVSMN
jgi:hypothetical protein